MAELKVVNDTIADIKEKTTACIGKIGEQNKQILNISRARDQTRSEMKDLEEMIDEYRANMVNH